MHAPYDIVGRLGGSATGIVAAVDPVRYAVKVRVQPEDVESGWIPLGAWVAGAARCCALPSINAQVTLVAARGDAEELIAVAGHYDTAVPVPVSPLTGQVPQPGEVFISTGNAKPPADNVSAGATSPPTVWMHMTATELAFGVPGVTVENSNGQISVKAGKMYVTGDFGTSIGWTGTFLDKTGRTVTVKSGIITDVA